MRPPHFFSTDNPLVRRVTYAEWCLLTVTIVLEVLGLAVCRTPATMLRMEFCVLFLTCLALLSIYWPLDKPLWWKYGVILLQIYLIGAASMIGYSRWTWPLYLVLVARASLLFESRHVWVILAFCFLSQTGWHLYNFLSGMPLTVWTKVLMSRVLAALLLTVSIGVMMVVVRWLMFTLLTEQKLRLETERLSSENEKLARQLERTRIAREIHDTLGHSLTSLKIQLELARRLLESNQDVDRAREALGQAEDLAARSLSDTRVALQSLRTNDFDFQRAVGDLLANLQSAGTLSVHAEIEASPLPSSVGYQLFRVLQESLTNVMKHAGASEVYIRINEGDRQVELEVRDNGRGFEPQAQSTNAFGLQGMKERIAALQGTLELNTTPGNGTSVVVKVPMA